VLPRPTPRTRRLLAGATAALVGLSGLAVGGSAAASDRDRVPDLHLVTLSGPGTAGGAREADLLERQDALLERVEASEPVYRWTAALNGFAVRLAPGQVADLEADPDVALVERNEVVDMAATTQPVTADRVAPQRRLRGGAGVVIGFVDSGIDPAALVFSDVPRLGRDSSDFEGTCAPGDGWPAGTCNRKVVGARWFVDGFGVDRLRSSETLSARDAAGHGTQVASVAAGNSGVTVRIGERNLGDFGGVAPQARVAVYKACWSAPDPAEDGCATADLVTAVDRATADRVDVLNLAVSGPNRTDTVERALLGAAEADVVAVAAAGNADRTSYAAHASPWTTTVGALSAPRRRGAVDIKGGPTLLGASRLARPLPPTRIVLAEDAAVAGAGAVEARQCRPGALDAAAVAGRVVVCERGGIGRIDKSAAVAQVDAAGMVLVNTRPEAVHDDFHDVPTVHLRAAAGETLRRWLTDHGTARASLHRARGGPGGATVAGWSSPGDPRGDVVKPDLVATGASVLGATPRTTGRDWALFSGTSAAAAHVSGLAALLRAEHRDWSATRVRSVLATTARNVPGVGALVEGSGRARTRPVRPGLSIDEEPRSYRRALETGSDALNTPSLLLRAGRSTATREITNLGARAEYFSVRVTGFEAHRVRVTPLAVRLAPGETARFQVSVEGTGSLTGLDSGAVTWRGARGSRTRIPVALTR
jgi:subtilisin family serine protease